MALHDDLLSLARHLVDRNPGAPVEADLRRAVSTAYYALFHLLVHESTTRLIAIPAVRSRVIRAYQHGDMRFVCDEYCNPKMREDALKQPIPAQIRDIASAFSALQEARSRSDYNTAEPVSHFDAEIEVIRAEVAFLWWTEVSANPATDVFLTELLCRSMKIPKR